MQRKVIALGFFDGVHLGHGALLRRVRALADARGLTAMALSFDVHPLERITGSPVLLLTSVQERERLMREQYGMDEVRFLPFDRHMLELPWERFLDEVLIGRENAAYVVCGYDYRFGFRGEGTPERLRAACAVRGIGCEVVDRVEVCAQTVSSTAIRAQIAAGAVARARQFLGHPYSVTGTVVHGNALGRTMGFPTANVCAEPAVLLPGRGVYITRAHIPAGVFSSVTNIGVRPTVGGDRVTVESWLADFSGDLYGQPIRLEFWEFLRPEQKFDDLSALSAQIKENASAARSYFAAPADAESEEQ